MYKFRVLNAVTKGTTYDPISDPINQFRAAKAAAQAAKRQEATVTRRKAREEGTDVGDLEFLFLPDGAIVKELMSVDEILQEPGGVDYLLSLADSGIKSGRAAFDAMSDLKDHTLKALRDSLARR
ncbi:hypothetical protein [uncultured Mediterranean phage uvMED]|nr:hypothetical protein [uncultured Mediterranean phage uvMED]